MTRRNRWEENADPRSGFDAHDPHPFALPSTSEPLSDHMKLLIRATAERARREQETLEKRRREALKRYEAGLAERTGKYARDRLAEMWGAA